MNQSIFEIRQQAEELLKEAIAIWRQSAQSDQLAGIENDPVFSLMLTALAYQLNDIDYDIERLKQDVLEDFSKQLVPYDMGRAQPATAVISTNLQPGVQALPMNERQIFRLGESNYQFVPLLSTQVLAAEVASVVRMDARRWKVKLKFNTPVTDLSGFSFGLSNPHFTDVKVTIGGKLVPLYKPWHFADLPLCKSFSLDTILYSQGLTFNASNTWFDLFARQDARLFCIKKHVPSTFINYEAEELDLVFEFSGINDNFVFDKSTLWLNTILLINAVPHNVTLTAAAPIARVAGYDERSAENSEQFMQLTHPGTEQRFRELTVDVRTVAADRFNRASLLKLLNSLTDKFDSDYYAFQQLRQQFKDNVIDQIRDGLQKLQRAYGEDVQSSIAGTYLMLRREETARQPDASLQVNYLTTNGAFVNSWLDGNSHFSLPSGLDSSATRLMTSPVGGTNEVSEKKQLSSLSRYYFATHDRIVTPADIKVFCYNELMTRYSISSDMVAAINVRTRLEAPTHGVGYVTTVEIRVHDTPFIKRHFTEKIPQAELIIQKMIEVRSTSIYPLQVNISIKDVEL